MIVPIKYSKQIVFKGATIDRYWKHVSNILDVTNKLPEMKGFYLVMDNALIHISDKLDKMIISRGYKYVYLLLYSSELNPIDQFWSIVKNKVKCSEFDDIEDLELGFCDACDDVPARHLKTFIQKSLEHFESYLNTVHSSSICI